MLREIFGLIVGSARRSSNRRHTNRQLDNISMQNQSAQNVNEYRAAPIEAFVPNQPDENIIVSGINESLRNRVNCAVAWRCHEANRSVIVLHCGNSNLSQMLDSTFQSVDRYYNISYRNPIYDPFIDQDRAGISQLILNSSGSNYKIERIGNSYIFGLLDYVQLINRSICFNTISNCLRDRSYEQIMDQAERGQISEFIARRINSELAQGKLEAGNIEHYFETLRQQGESIFANESTIDSAISIKKAIRQNSVIAIDISDSTNSLLLNLIIQEIKDAISSGMRFSLIVDSIPVDSSEALGQLLRTFSGRCSFTYSSQDVYADTQSTSNIFNTLLGRAQTVFVLKHTSATSCHAFSEFFGQYQKIEVNHSFTSGDTYATYGQILPGSTSTNIYGTQHLNRARVEDSEIISQSIDHAFIRRSGNDEIISVRCSTGESRTRYDAPQRNTSRQASRSSRNPINWLLFAFLFIICPPAGLIYSIVKCGRVGKIISGIFLVLIMLFYIFSILVVTGVLNI